MMEKAAQGTDFHREQAVQFFNDTWDLIDKKDRTPQEDLLMIHTAHASRFHWGKAGGPLEFLRGEWQISRVYSLLNMGESALYHALDCLTKCEENQISGFDLAFAYEALARACKVLGDTAGLERFRALAETACAAIPDEQDRDYAKGEITSL